MKKEVRVPDIGGATRVDVIEVQVAPGDRITKEQSLITLEGDKATMEIPSPFDGLITEVHTNVGDQISEGDLIAVLSTSEEQDVPPPVPSEPVSPDVPEAPETPLDPTQVARDLNVYAGPAVRRMANAFNIDLTQVPPSGDKGRILKQDLDPYLKPEPTPQETTDFSRFGQVDIQPLSRIKKSSGMHLQSAWREVPHVTQFDQADITEMESFRQRHKDKAQGFKLTPIVFVMKAVVAALKQYPMFNASLDASGTQLYMKQYIHLGVAVDTPQGLVVPVVRDVDQKSLLTLAQELGALSTKARAGQLSLTDMQGGCFTLSSLGGIGGTQFTPIVNTPEVGILGISKAAMLPVYSEGSFVPRLMLPLSLSYDHRVIDGALGARFLVCICAHLSDLTMLLL